MKHWRERSWGEKNKILFVAVGLIGGLYAMLVYPTTQKAFVKSEGMINRRLDRMEKRIPPKIETKGNFGQLDRRKQELDTELASLSKQIEVLQSRFAPLDSPSEQQRLRLEISELARTEGLMITRFVEVPGDTAKQGASDTEQQAVRPMMRLQAQATYWGVLRFLDGLAGLSYEAAVVRLDVQIAETAAKKDKDTPAPQQPGLLRVDLGMVL